MLVISTDPVIVWLLRHQYKSAGRCVSYFLTESACLRPERRYDTVIAVTGHNSNPDDAPDAKTFALGLAKLLQGRQKAATIHAGFDNDAALKSRLTGVALTPTILTVDLYR